MISSQPSTHITRAFMAAEMGKRIFLLLSAAISCSLAVVAGNGPWHISSHSNNDSQ
jgi:hypothetical protein